MNRSFLVNLLFLLSINLLIKPFYLFGIDRVVQNTVPDVDYGLYAVFFDLAYLLQLINDFGIQHYNTRTISQNSQQLPRYFPNIITLKSGLAIIYGLVLGIVGLILGYTFEQFQLLYWIGFNQILVSLILYLRSNIAGLAFYRLDSFFSILDKLLMIIICGSLLIMTAGNGNFQIEWFVWSQTASLLLTSFAAFIWLLSKVKTFSFQFNLSLLWKIFKESYPYSLILFLMTVYTRTDTIMIERLLENGKAEAAIYKSAFRLFDAASMIGVMFGGLLLPMFARLLKTREGLSELIQLSLKIILAGSTAGTMAIIFYRREIMEALYISGDAYSGDILGFLMIGFLAISGTFVYGSLLSANGNTTALNWLFFTTAVLNISLNFFLIPEFKALGAAQATAITQTIVIIGEAYLAYRLIKLTFKPALLLQIALFLLLIGLLNLGISQLAFNWLIKFLLSLITGLILSFILRLINISYLIQLLKNK